MRRETAASLPVASEEAEQKASGSDRVAQEALDHTRWSETLFLKKLEQVNGLDHRPVVRLPHGAVREGKERVGAAIVNSAFQFPLKRITVNLAPADVRKDGSAFDLPIAIGILAATGQLNGKTGEREDGRRSESKPYLADYLIVGEFGLEGDVRPIRGALPVAVAAKAAGLRGVVVPVHNLSEAGVVDGFEVSGARTL